MSTRLLLTADDRTGALELGGLLAGEGRTIPVGPQAHGADITVIDIDSRHLSSAAAQDAMAAALAINAEQRAHKMDGGLRGNWADEIRVLLDAGYRVAVVCSFPDAGRICRDGVVYINGQPVTESLFAADPRHKPVSSRPRDVLDAAGITGDVVVWDAADNAQLDAAVARAHAEQRLLVGASGAVSRFAERVVGRALPSPVALPAPLVVLCGSLNPMSRRQLEALPVAPVPIDGHSPNWSPEPGLNVLATPPHQGAVEAGQAQAVAAQCADWIVPMLHQIGTLVVVGGDTLGAIVGPETVHATGLIAPAMPVSQYRGCVLVTKGGGIGQPDTLARLVAMAFPNGTGRNV